MLAERWRLHYNTICLRPFARLPIASARDVATQTQNRVWGRWNANYTSHFPTPSTVTGLIKGSLR